MGQILFAVVAANLILFAAISVWAFNNSRTESYPRMKLMTRGLGVVALAFVVGAATRLAAIAVELGWLHGRVSDFLVSEWHLIQSLFALGLGLTGIAVIKRLAPSLKGAERLADAVSEQLLGGADLTDMGLTRREMEVIETLAAGHISDAEIGELLFISPATASTHVKNILRKTGLRNRREIALLFASTPQYKGT